MNAAVASGPFRSFHPRAAVAVALSFVFGILLVVAFVIKGVKTGFVPDDAAYLVSLVAAQAVGLLLVVRQPGNRVGWIVCLLAWAMAAQQFIWAYQQLALQQGWSLTAVLWIDGKTFLWLWGGMMALI